MNDYENELKSIEEFLAKPDAYASPDFATKSKRANILREIIELNKKIVQFSANLTEAESLFDDPELGEIAKDDAVNLKNEIKTAKAQLDELLIPSDPADDKPAIIEIRAGAGGDEASLFAAELFRLYQKYAEAHNLKFELISKNENEAGGMKEVIFKLTGEEPYGKLKFQMRKLWQMKDDKRLHLIAWLDDKKITDEYYPQVDFGYTFRAIKDTSNGEIYYVLQSIDRAYLYGYSQAAQKLVTYVDSLNYAHAPNSYPYIVALKNGTLVLAFEQTGKKSSIRSRYQFRWDASKNWFAYYDLGTGWPSISTDKQ